MRGSLAYLLLLRDDYPATDDLQEVTLEIAYPDVERHLNRFLPLVKWLLALLALPPTSCSSTCGMVRWCISEQYMRGGHRSDDAATER